MQMQTKWLKGFAGVFVLLIGLSTVAVAQTDGQDGFRSPDQTVEIDPDSQEFELFVTAYSEVAYIQQEVNQEVEELISDSPLTDQRFREIHQQMQSRGGGNEAQISQQEKDRYQELLAQIQELQRSSQEEMIAEVEAVDMTVERFNEIIVALQNDQELQQELHRRMEQQS